LQPPYEVDEETQTLLESVLNMVAQTSTLQIDEDSANALLDICDEVAERFNIKSYQITVKEQEPADDEQSITVYGTERDTPKPKPKFTVIEGKNKDKP